MEPIILHKLSLNLIDEITTFLEPKDIVCLMGTNQYYHSLWDTRIALKIFKSNLKFAIHPRKYWMIIQSKHVNIEAKTYAYVNSRQEIYFLKILYDPIKIYMIHEGLLKYWMSGNALETVNQPEINFSTHAVAYENDCVAILFTNNTLRFITDFDKTHDIQYDDKHFDQFNVVKIFYLTYANYLVINTTRGMCIFINKQGKIEAIQKTGLIENYTLLPKIPTGFFTYKDGTLLLITKNEQKTVMTVNPRYREYPKIVLDKLRKKVIICKWLTPPAAEINPKYVGKVEVKSKFKNYFLVENQYFACSKERIYMIDENEDVVYEFDLPTQLYTEVVGDQNIVLVNRWSYDNISLIDLHLRGFSSSFCSLNLKSKVEILSFNFPYLLISQITNEFAILRLLKF